MREPHMWLQAVDSGQTLTFRDGKQKAKVISPTQVLFRGKKMSLMRATVLALGGDYLPHSTAHYWLDGDEWLSAKYWRFCTAASIEMQLGSNNAISESMVASN